MFGGALERRDVSASNAFGFKKKYSKSRKCEMIFDRNVKSSLAFFQMQNVELLFKKHLIMMTFNRDELHAIIQPNCLGGSSGIYETRITLTR